MAHVTQPRIGLREYMTFLLSLGFQVGRASPCNFTHRTRRVHLTVHGEDFTVVASAKQIAWLGEAMKKRFELKMEVLGPNAGQTEEVRALNRIIRWTRTGLEYEPDQRHAERIISELELETCMSVSTPRVQESVSATRAMIVEGVELDDKEARRLRALAARLKYLAGDRPDLLFACECICKNTARPRSEDWLALKRVGRYLKGATRMVQQFHWASDDTNLHGYADSDWAGDRQNMKSTSGGVIMWSGHCIKAWPISQSALALSSGEAELYAMTKVAVQLSGVISMAKDFGVSMTRVVKSDSSSAIGIAHRDGLGGRCRHIKVQYLWTQSKIKDGDLKLQKVLGTNNVADAMTKAVDRWALDKYMAAMNFTLMPGRADKASRAQ